MSERHETDTLAGRISLLVRDISANSFAKKCGISEGSIRQYLSGTIPRLDKVVTMAGAAGVRLEWLAVGKGPMRDPDPTHRDNRRIDEALLAQIVATVVENRLAAAPSQGTAEIGRLSAEIYDIVSVLGLQNQPERDAAIRYALEYQRRSHCGLSMPPGSAAP